MSKNKITKRGKTIAIFAGLLIVIAGYLFMKRRKLENKIGGMGSDFQEVARQNPIPVSASLMSGNNDEQLSRKYPMIVNTSVYELQVILKYLFIAEVLSNDVGSIDAKYGDLTEAAHNEAMQKFGINGRSVNQLKGGMLNSEILTLGQYERGVEPVDEGKFNWNPFGLFS